MCSLDTKHINDLHSFFFFHLFSLLILQALIMALLDQKLLVDIHCLKKLNNYLHSEFSFWEMVLSSKSVLILSHWPQKVLKYLKLSYSHTKTYAKCWISIDQFFLIKGRTHVIGNLPFLWRSIFLWICLFICLYFIYMFICKRLNNRYKEFKILRVWTELFLYIKRGNMCTHIPRAEVQGPWGREGVE